MTKRYLYFQKKKEKRFKGISSPSQKHTRVFSSKRHNQTRTQNRKLRVPNQKNSDKYTDTHTHSLSLSFSLCKYLSVETRETIQAIMSCFRSNPSVLLLSFSLFFFFSISSSFGNSHVHHTLHIPGNNFALVLFVFVARNMFVNLCLCVCYRCIC